jgi:NAD(P)H-hydrate repair Nnr-like enzyme with NAD(P)H-hydrate epimerase domain
MQHLRAGIFREHLMNQAGSGIAETVQRFFPRPGYCLIFSGKGNNGGDALVAAAHLKRAGWHTDVHLSFPESECSELLRKKITEFRDTPPAVGAAVSAADLGGSRPSLPSFSTVCWGLDRSRHYEIQFWPRVARSIAYA